MIYINKFAVQASVVTFVFFTSYSLGNIGSVKANELRSSSTSQNISNVERTLQKIENDILVEPSTLEHEKISQDVTSVSQLSDVKPNDWAFTSLQSLVERYGCIAGYPDRTFLGKQALSRYEFTAGLNACLDKINEIISAGLADKVSKDDLASLKELQEEFAPELPTLRGSVDTIDAKLAKVESQKFSTTTKLNASIIFTIADTWGGFDTGTALQNPQPTKNASNTTFSYRARLNFDTSFTGKDLLRARLQAGNNPNLGSNNPATSPTNTNMARLSSASNTDNFFRWINFTTDSELEIERLLMSV